MRRHHTTFAYRWLAGPLLCAALAVPTRAQDAFGYTATNSTPYSYVDISSTGTSVLAGDDDAAATVQLGFSFSFYGASYSSICLSTNGDAGLGACPGGDAQNVDLTSQAPGGDTPLIAPFWSDLTFAAPGAGSVVYQTLGTPGSLRFIAQWNNAMALNASSPYNFQIVLSQGSNQILFQYQSIDGGPSSVADGAGATVGIRAAGAQKSQFDYQWSFDAPVLTSGSAILFTPPSNTFCASLSASAASLLYDASGGAATINITAASTCPWTATADSPWIVVKGATGKGNGSLSVTIPPNTTGIQQTGNLYIGGQTIPVTERATTAVFADVTSANYYFDAVDLLSTKGITHGCGVNDYCPLEDVTRSQMAIFIVRAIIGSDNFTYSPTPHFADVPTTGFGFAWIQKMFELGITTGCGGGNYCPNSDVTRAQMAVFIIRMRYGATAVFDYPPTPYFTDVPASEFAFAWVQRMKEDGITAGCGATTYCPNNPVTRGDMSIFLMRGAFNQLLPSGAAILTSVNPSTLPVGGTATITITGTNTHFAQGTTSLAPLVGITVNSLTVVNASTLVADVTVGAGAAAGPQSLLAITGTPPGNEEAVLPNGLLVQ